MKYLKRFTNAQEAATVLATWPFNTISSIEGQSGVRYSEGVPVGPVIPTDRIILKFMVTAEDWNEDAGKYQKQLVITNSEELYYTGDCFAYMIKDGVEIDEDFWSQFIYFDTVGEHTVELVFDEEFDGTLPHDCFHSSGIYKAIIPSCVTSIGYNVFTESYAMISVIISEDITDIEGGAFFGCWDLTSITCNAINPPSIDSALFDDTNNCPIYVPASSVDAYKAAAGWSEYASRIQAIQS